MAAYDSTVKNAVRHWVVTELRAAEPRLVLDLWGGGESARLMAEAGLDVLTVDDGRSGTSQEELEGAGVAEGYRTAWGPAEQYAGWCDAAWLDFCGHWCPEVSRTIRACRHMRLLVVTLMPERTPIADSRLSVDEWTTALAALVSEAAGMRVTAMRRYRRGSGLWALVFFARPANRHSEYQRKRYAEDPAYRERVIAASAAQREKPLYRDRIRAYTRARRAALRQDPEWRARKQARLAERLRTEPEWAAAYRERRNAAARERTARLTPEQRELQRARQRERYRQRATSTSH